MPLMSDPTPKTGDPILVLVRDLMFVSKIRATAAAQGAQIKTIRDSALLATEAGTRLLVDLSLPTVLLLGSEAAGLPDDLLRAARRRVRIPMAQGVESLNVHAAAASLLYEVARQRDFRFRP